MAPISRSSPQCVLACDNLTGHTRRDGGPGRQHLRRHAGRVAGGSAGNEQFPGASPRRRGRGDSDANGRGQTVPGPFPGRLRVLASARATGSSQTLQSSPRQRDQGPSDHTSRMGIRGNHLLTLSSARIGGSRQGVVCHRAGPFGFKDRRLLLARGLRANSRAPWVSQCICPPLDIVTETELADRSSWPRSPATTGNPTG